MSIALDQTALMFYLKAKHADMYYSKALELRDAVKGWLAYIPHSFPHYTRHTVEHSDEIVVQMSKLLFEDNDPQRPVVHLSAIEAYILIAAAYLHDSGMVVPDKEKEEILRSDAWKHWTSGDGGGARRWNEIHVLRQGNEVGDYAVRNFLADIQTRFLIAEFVRRTHHLRAADVITNHQSMLGRFAFDDPMLMRTISDVCVSHGLRQHELEDKVRYPDRRDIRGEIANVQFLAIMLRLGDLLDMSYDRACPLLLNAACPLPAESLAHWTQYQRIAHRLTANDLIEITAECQNHDEHRYLQDWCQWLVEEVKNAATLVARARRHHDWQLPEVELTGAKPTIIIKPAPNASYIPSDWTFELDHEAIYQRLIRDVYDDPMAFIRELIQNALDANRCQMYLDLKQDGVEVPEYPTQVAEERRNRYPVKLSLSELEIKNSLSGETHKRQVLTIEDSGIGMDRDIIKRYFLQVGRSFYRTDEFRRQFRFVPTSRFGLGFLSVFAVSDQVVVETYKPSSPINDGPIRLTLTGPRNYLLTEKGRRRLSGTRIEVFMREPMEQGALTRRVSEWCRRVEFPVVVDDLGTQTTIVAERPEQFTCEMPDVTREHARFIIRAFPIDRPGIEGELYVLAYVDEQGEAWDRGDWAQNIYPQLHPQAIAPKLPVDLLCLHGIAISKERSAYTSARVRLDYRSDAIQPTVARDGSTSWRSDPLILGRWEEILIAHVSTSHKANSEDSWVYKQRLINDFSFLSFWDSLPGMIRIYMNNLPHLVSLKEIQAMNTVTTIVTPAFLQVGYPSQDQKDLAEIPHGNREVPLLIEKDLARMSSFHTQAIFKERSVTSIQWIHTDYVSIDWMLEEAQEKDLFRIIDGYSMQLADIIEIEDVGVVAFSIGRSFIGHSVDRIIINKNNIFVCWLIDVKNRLDVEQETLRRQQFQRLVRMFFDAVRYPSSYLASLTTFLERWRQMPGLPPELYPPDIEFTARMFQLRPPSTDSKPKKPQPKQRKAKRSGTST
jgi:hypothetical protein